MHIPFISRSNSSSMSSATKAKYLITELLTTELAEVKLPTHRCCSSITEMAVVSLDHGFGVDTFVIKDLSKRLKICVS